MSEKTIAQCEAEVLQSRKRIAAALNQLEARLAISRPINLQTTQLVTSQYAFFLECLSLGLYAGQLVAVNQKVRKQAPAEQIWHAS